MNEFEWTNATTVAEAVGQLGPDVFAKAGGVDLLDLMKERIVSPRRLVNLRTIPGLDRIRDTPEGLRVGPLVTLARIGSDPAVRQRYRALADAAGHAATPQIRNAATAAGNLLQRPRCWYFRQEAFPCRKKGGHECFAQHGENAYHAVFDNHLCAAVHPSALGVALVAFGARLEIAGPEGVREIEIGSFFTSPEQGVMRENTLGSNDLVTGIHVPLPRPGSSSAYLKQGEKASFDWPLVEVAVTLERTGNTCTGASVVLGGVAHKPWRVRGAEVALVGRAVNEASAMDASAAALAGATPMIDNAYKIPIARAIVRRTILAAAGVSS